MRFPTVTVMYTGPDPWTPQRHPPSLGGVWGWSGDFHADNLRGAPFLFVGGGNWRGQDILCDALVRLITLKQ